MFSSERPGFQPFFDLRQAVGAEEGLAVDDTCGEPKTPDFQRLIHFVLESALISGLCSAFSRLLRSTPSFAAISITVSGAEMS
jgi:hypothetical protein